MRWDVVWPSHPPIPLPIPSTAAPLTNLGGWAHVGLRDVTTKSNYVICPNVLYVVCCTLTVLGVSALYFHHQCQSLAVCDFVRTVCENAIYVRDQHPPSPNRTHTDTSTTPFDTYGFPIDSLVPLCALPGYHLHGPYVPYPVRAPGACDAFFVVDPARNRTI